MLLHYKRACFLQALQDILCVFIKAQAPDFEPWTYRLQGDCSNQLSYKGIIYYNQN